MSFFTSLFGGNERKQNYNDPQLTGWQTDMYNFDPGLGYAGKRDKQILKSLDRGDDVSSLGELNSISQSHAANRRDIGDNYMYGANALVAGSGGEQANILNRQKQNALDTDYERMGQEYTQGVTNLRGQAESGFANARNTRISAELAAKQAAMGSRQAYNSQQYSWLQNRGLFPTLAGLAASAGTAAGSGGLAGL